LSIFCGESLKRDFAIVFPLLMWDWSSGSLSVAALHLKELLKKCNGKCEE